MGDCDCLFFFLCVFVVRFCLPRCFDGRYGENAVLLETRFTCIIQHLSSDAKQMLPCVMSCWVHDDCFCCVFPFHGMPTVKHEANNASIHQSTTSTRHTQSKDLAELRQRKQKRFQKRHTTHTHRTHTHTHKKKKKKKGKETSYCVGPRSMYPPS